MQIDILFSINYVWSVGYSAFSGFKCLIDKLRDTMLYPVSGAR